jgi:hypothetical protein
MSKIPAKVLQTPVQGRSLQGATLADVLGESPTLLVFLRHLG